MGTIVHKRVLGEMDRLFLHRGDRRELDLFDASSRHLLQKDLISPEGKGRLNFGFWLNKSSFNSITVVFHNEFAVTSGEAWEEC